MEAQQNQPEWALRLAELIATGLPIDTAVAICANNHVPEALVRNRAKRLRARRPSKATAAIATRLRCREWWLRAYASLMGLAGEASGVDVVAELPEDRFLTDYYFRNRAVCFPGLARDWPALSLWTRTYLGKISTEVRVMIGRDQVPIDKQSTPSGPVRTMGFGDYVDLVYSGKITNDYYLVAKNRFFDQPETRRLLLDIHCPPYVRVSKDVASVSMWFGPGGTITPLHYDDKNTLLVQVVGRKAVRLYAPYFSEAMEQREPWYAQLDPGIADTFQRLPIDVVGTSLELGPSDGLFIPVGWWHAVEALDVSVTLSFKEFGVPNDYGQP